MDLARALAADLLDLAVDLSVDGYTGTAIAMMERNLRRSVASVLGASVTLRTPASPEVPVTVNFVSRTIGVDEIRSVLRIPMPGLSDPRSGTITFYAGQPDAFTQLLPLLADALHLDPAEIGSHQPLPTTAVTPSVEGLHDFSAVNRAVGVLLNRGYTLADARAELAQQIGRTGADITAVAHQLLSSMHYR